MNPKRKKETKKPREVKPRLDLDTLLVAYKIGAITLDDIKRFIKLSK